jgi:O-acetyl-ADP-ribose deacetylase
MTVRVQEIPSISLLYRLGRLSAADLDELPDPLQSFNNRVATIRGDITKLGVDAIVNAANNSLLGGGGVDGAIHRAAGQDLLRECRSLEGCDTGSAKITDAYLLPCEKVIHAVGPIFDDTREEICAQLLANCYTKCLELAVENDCKSIALCSLSTGIYGYPSQAAALVAIKTVRDFLEGENGDKLEKIVFCTFEKKDVNAYNAKIP